jgi:hypothetical protein
MSQNCNHDCSSCGENCPSRGGIPKEKLNELSSVKKVIGIVSGKGGVENRWSPLCLRCF